MRLTRSRLLAMAVVKTGHLATIGLVRYLYAVILAVKGDGGKAKEHLENAIKDMEASHTSLLLGPAWAWLGFAHCLLAHHELAVELTEKGLRMHTELGMAHRDPGATGVAALPISKRRTWNKREPTPIWP